MQQLKKRRLSLKLKQRDMMQRVGISRQQYQRLESKGNPRLDTLTLVAAGLNSELMLIPKEKLSEVTALLQNKPLPGHHNQINEPSIADDPWRDLLGDDYES